MARDRLIAAIFIPHEGCPYRCVFCSQKDITGAQGQADRNRVEHTLKTYLNSKNSLPARREAAFYGGSFTGLPLHRQEYLLSVVQPWIDSGEIHAIRVSTHPLFVDKERMNLLRRYRVETVELGIQSTDANVLNLSGRECSLTAMENAVDLVRANGFQLGLQLMSGLPGDNEFSFQKSVDDVIRWHPDFVRLYPTVVIRHTPLYRMYRENKFIPWSLDQTIESLKTAVLKFNRAGIPVSRLGLHPDPSLLENLVAGPYHPAMRYLVDSRIRLDQMIAVLKGLDFLPKTVVFDVPSRDVSTYTGNRRENIYKLKSLFRLDEVKVRGGEGLEKMKIAF